MSSVLPSTHGRGTAMHASSHRSPMHAPTHRHRGRVSAASVGHEHFSRPTAERLSNYQRALGAGFVPVCTSCIHAVQRQFRHSSTLGRRSPVATATTWQATTEQQQGAVGMEAAAERLAVFCDALQEDEPAEGEESSMRGLTDSQLANLLSNVPGLIQEDPGQVREKLDAISEGTGLDLAQTANLLARVPAAWNRSAEALVSRLTALGSEMGVSPAQAGALLTAVPSLFAITASIVKDRFDSLALRLGLPLTLTVELVVRQPLIWAVPVQQIQSGVPRLCERLGLSTSEAVDLAARVPVVLALEERLLNMQVGGLSSVLGVPVSSLVELLGRCLGLVAVPAEVLGANLSNLASALRVREEDALEVVLTQPTLLNAQLASISTALDCLESGLNLTSRAQALRLLCQQPGLLYDLTVPAINEKLETLAALFQVSVSEVRIRAAEQPTLLVLAPYTLQAALAEAVATGGEEATPERCMQLLVDDPGTFMSLAHTSEELAKWTGRLGLDEAQMSAMAETQPALLEMAPNTLKARLESLAALFGVSLDIAAQLVSRHPALATIPPNVVITRVKSLSMALGSTMQTVGVLVAKAPAVLACCIVVPGEVNRDLQPHTNAVSEVVAAYEFYTMEWLQRSIREAAPARARSFSQLDARL